MLNTKNLANASALTAFLLYMACVLLAIVSPSILIGIFTIMFHGLTLSTTFIQNGINLGDMILGSLLFSGLTWVSFFTFGFIYNKLSK